MPLSGAVPWSLSLLLAGPTLVAALLWILWPLLRRRRLWYAVGRLFCVIVLGYAWFLLGWGANYRRVPLDERLALTGTPVTTSEVERLAARLLEVIAREADAERDLDAALASGMAALRATAERIEGRPVTLPPRVKRTPPGLLLRAGASGVFAPWLLEPHVDGALPDYQHLAVALHELAHAAGYAGEADADLMAALAGLTASDPFMRYSTALRFLETVAGRLPAASRTALLATLPEPAQADLAQWHGVLREYHVPAWLRGLQFTLYDRYLRSQGVSEGIADYGRVVTLLVAADRAGLVP
jgi:hypothetical protein